MGTAIAGSLLIVGLFSSPCIRVTFLARMWSDHPTLVLQTVFGILRLLLRSVSNFLVQVCPPRNFHARLSSVLVYAICTQHSVSALPSLFSPYFRSSCSMSCPWEELGDQLVEGFDMVRVMGVVQLAKGIFLHELAVMYFEV